jgi:purine-binding chemotaxis protein CheW
MTTELMSVASGRGHAEGNDQYLTFRLGRENYGLDILKVQEIRGYDANITAIANAPAFIKGVVNLRGIIVPIIDMRIKFRMADVAYDGTTVIIVLNLAERVVGMVVDAVSDVLTIHGEDIRPAPSIGDAVNTDYVTGIATVDERMVILVDIGRLISSDDLASTGILAV